ncbi:hypothetical protein BJ508DRAFT_377117 [Ascobolus immersus RN42]|uniref:Uncharacterized protein n=1 Tax=Ascobolus immersus RN42 TaxID=1160509 RepID=A0A3N4I2U1_ASCIM|nr:hypothetical protein BJ508DRAFT_377117 [Ascobolus immersus RN42]
MPFVKREATEPAYIDLTSPESQSQPMIGLGAFRGTTFPNKEATPKQSSSPPRPQSQSLPRTQSPPRNDGSPGKQRRTVQLPATPQRRPVSRARPSGGGPGQTYSPNEHGRAVARSRLLLFDNIRRHLPFISTHCHYTNSVHLYPPPDSTLYEWRIKEERYRLPVFTDGTRKPLEDFTGGEHVLLEIALHDGSMKAVLADVGDVAWWGRVEEQLVAGRSTTEFMRAVAIQRELQEGERMQRQKMKFGLVATLSDALRAPRQAEGIQKQQAEINSQDSRGNVRNNITGFSPKSQTQYYNFTPASYPAQSTMSTRVSPFSGVPQQNLVAGLKVANQAPPPSTPTQSNITNTEAVNPVTAPQTQPPPIFAGPSNPSRAPVSLPPQGQGNQPAGKPYLPCEPSTCTHNPSGYLLDAKGTDTTSSREQCEQRILNSKLFLLGHLQSLLPSISLHDVSLDPRGKRYNYRWIFAPGYIPPSYCVDGKVMVKSFGMLTNKDHEMLRRAMENGWMRAVVDLGDDSLNGDSMARDTNGNGERDSGGGLNHRPDGKVPERREFTELAENRPPDDCRVNGQTDAKQNNDGIERNHQQQGGTPSSETQANTANGLEAGFSPNSGPSRSSEVSDVAFNNALNFLRSFNNSGSNSTIAGTVVNPTVGNPTANDTVMEQAPASQSSANEPINTRESPAASRNPVVDAWDTEKASTEAQGANNDNSNGDGESAEGVTTTHDTGNSIHEQSIHGESINLDSFESLLAQVNDNVTNDNTTTGSETSHGKDSVMNTPIAVQSNAALLGSIDRPATSANLTPENITILSQSNANQDTTVSRKELKRMERKLKRQKKQMQSEQEERAGLLKLWREERDYWMSKNQELLEQKRYWKKKAKKTRRKLRHGVHEKGNEEVQPPEVEN